MSNNNNHTNGGDRSTAGGGLGSSEKVGEGGDKSTSNDQGGSKANVVAMKSLPKVLHPYYSMDSIKNADIPVNDKLNLVKQYGKGSKDW